MYLTFLPPYLTIWTQYSGAYENRAPDTVGWGGSQMLPKVNSSVLWSNTTFVIKISLDHWYCFKSSQRRANSYLVATLNVFAFTSLNRYVTAFTNTLISRLFYWTKRTLSFFFLSILPKIKRIFVWTIWITNRAILCRYTCFLGLTTINPYINCNLCVRVVNYPRLLYREDICFFFYLNVSSVTQNNSLFYQPLVFWLAY